MRESKKHTVGKRANRAGLCVCLAGLIAVSPGVTSYAAEPSGSNSTLIRGDVNLDSTVNLKDAIQVQKFALGMIDFNDEQKKCADVDNNDSVNLLDSILVQKYAVGVETGVKGIGEPITDPTEPPTTPTEPTKPTEPVTKPTEPPTQPTEPTEPSEAEYEWVPIYERRDRVICNGCGLDITNTDLGHIWDCGPNYHDEKVWLFYGTDEWVVKNKDVGNRTVFITTGDDVDALGNHYKKTIGEQGAEDAIREADQMIVDLWFLQDDTYKLKTVPIYVCTTKDSTGEVCYTDFILRDKDALEQHKKRHEDRGEEFTYVESDMEVLYKKVKVEK